MVWSWKKSEIAGEYFVGPISVIRPSSRIVFLNWPTRWLYFFLLWCPDACLSSLPAYPIPLHQLCLVTWMRSVYSCLWTTLDIDGMLRSADPSPSHLPSSTGFFYACCHGSKQLSWMCSSCENGLPTSIWAPQTWVVLKRPIYHLTVDNYLPKCDSYPIPAFQLPLR